MRILLKKTWQLRKQIKLKKIYIYKIEIFFLIFLNNVHAYYTATHQINKQMEIRFLAVYYKHPVRKKQTITMYKKKQQDKHYNHLTIIFKFSL